MTPPIPTIEPDSLFAGDTVKWNKTISDYPATDGWTLTYSFRGPSAFPDQAAQPSGTGYAVAIAASTTQNLAAGTYNWNARVSKAGETYTVARGVLTVTLVVGAAQQVHEEKMLAAIEAAIEGRVVADVEQYTINGRMVTKIPIKQLLRLRSVYQAKVWRLRNPGKIGVPVAVVFSAPDGNVGSPSPVALPPYYPYGR